MGGSKRETKSIRRLEASLYFLQWTKTILQAYTRTISELYLKKLIQHCTRRKVEQANSKDEVEQLAAGPKIEEKSEHASIRERIKEGVAAHWQGGHIAKQYKISVAELAAMHRLTQLTRVAGTLLDIMERTRKWNDDHFKLIRKHAISLDLMEYVMAMFNGTRCVGEIFRLTSVDFSQCREEYRDILGDVSDAYEAKNNTELAIGVPKKYIPLLETQIVHFRTILHLIGTSLIIIIQIILRYVPQEQIDIRVRELKDALDQLPPMYLKTDNIKLTKLAARMTHEAPPNKRSYPLCPKAVSGKSVRSGKKKRVSSRSSQKKAPKKANVVKGKIKNLASNAEPSQKSNKEKSQKSAKSRKSRGSPKSAKSGKSLKTQNTQQQKSDSSRRGSKD